MTDQELRRLAQDLARKALECVTVDRYMCFDEDRSRWDFDATDERILGRELEDLLRARLPQGVMVP